jgi:hypothetical protein
MYLKEAFKKQSYLRNLR